MPAGEWRFLFFNFWTTCFGKSIAASPYAAMNCGGGGALPLWEVGKWDFPACSGQPLLGAHYHPGIWLCPITPASLPAVATAPAVRHNPLWQQMGFWAKPQVYGFA